MKNKTKIMISALSVMLVMVLAVTIVSFSRASRQDEPEIQDVTLMADAADNANMTIVDRIIENSNLKADEDGDGENENDPYYHIVEIGSSASHSMAPTGTKSYLDFLSQMDDEGVSAFKSYVIDGNKTIEQLMKEGRIDYKYYQVTSITAADIETIADADLIYVSNDPKNMYTAGTNDLSEDLYSALLHTYVNNKQRPLIIDNPIETQNISGEQDTTVPFGDLVKNVFNAKGSRYYTFAWDTSKNAADAAGAENFLSHKNGSLYLGINGDNKAGHWIPVTIGDAAADATTEEATTEDASSSDASTDATTEEAGGNTEAVYNMATVLIISTRETATHTDNPLANALFTGFGNSQTVMGAAGTSYAGVSYANVYRLYADDAAKTPTLFYNKAYNTRYPSRPDFVQVTETTLATLDANVADIDLDQYDMIIMESGMRSTRISADLYRKFSAAMLANVTMVYNSDNASSGSTNTGNEDFDATASKYNMLYSTVASTSGVSKKPNVMVTNAEDFGVIAQSNSAATCKKIADLLNASAFREYGGANSSSTKFTVLELQPCYPIDEEVALKSTVTHPNAKTLRELGIKGNYYTVPAEVLNAPKEQVSTLNADGTIETPEYYAWELSEAKIADALDMDINNVQVVHMSSEEMAASTADILGTYDLVYIGGNQSALKDATQWQALGGISGNGINHGLLVTAMANGNIRYLPIYTMYTHNGDLTAVDVSSTGYSGSKVRGGKAYANVNGKDSFTTLNGNDVTAKQAQKLIQYVKAGMPVIISDDAAAGYQALVDVQAKDNNPYLQNSIDPDCNMAKVLKACYDLKNEVSVLWDFDKDAVCHTDNAGGALGTTNVGYVEVFASESGQENIDDGVSVTGQKEKIADVYNASYKRPILEVTKTPKRYDDTKEDSTVDIIDDKSVLEFEYTIKGSSKCEVKLRIDDDGNGRYDDVDDPSHDGSDTSLRVEMADTFYGPISWKLEAKDTVTGITSGITGISYVAPKRVEDKQDVKVLQIMPGGDLNKSETAEGANSLYFCVVCQQACERLETNPLANNASWFNIHYSGNYFAQTSLQTFTIGRTLNHAPWYESTAISVNNVGTHEHVFGIPYYDANLQYADKDNVSKYGADDWHINLADDLSDRFNFDIDILTRDEVEEISDSVRAAYDFSKMTDAEKRAAIKKFEDNVDLEAEEFADYVKYKADDIDEKLTYITQYNSETYASEYWNLYTYMRDEKAVADSFEDVDDPNADPANPDVGNAGNGGTGEQNKTFTDPITGANIEITQTTLDAKTDLNEMLDKLVTSLEAQGKTALVEEVQYIIRTERYYDLFNASEGKKFVFRDANILSYLSFDDVVKLFAAYNDYVKAKDTELEYKEQYKKYDREAHADNWIKGCYSTVILGPSDDFAADDFTAGSNGLKDLTNYVKDDGNVLLFHDTFTRFSDAGSYNLTEAIRPYVGQDKNHMEIADASYQYVKYKTAANYDEEKYFLTNLSYKTGDDKYPTWYDDLKPYQYGNSGAGSSRLYSAVAYSDALHASNDSSNPSAVAYKYAYLDWSYAAYWYNAASFDPRDNEQYGTNRGSKNNDGLITLYPFTLSDDIYIAGTHPQSYALDLEDDKCTVWYSLAGGYNGQQGSSMFAASPRDGQDNYFIYSYKNVYYCGAGHSKVTGVGKMNNDERKLYINIICNSVRKSAAMPSIYIYDYDKDTYGDKIKRKDGSYYTKVDDTDEYPEFSFKATTDSESTLDRVRIYYDLDYSDDNRSNAYVNNESHVLIADWDSKNVERAVRKNVYRYDPTLKTLVDQNDDPIVDSTNEDGTSNIASALKLKPEYFDPYNGEYTYIVIEATDSSDNKVYQRIKVMLKDVLFNLT
ncbi:MAG: DUF5057 domain-containing protein [Clostridium sp.]|nr:DUF5057 domain-containing protein [Clostridium sp.]MCM1400232.1 DUF5057 domain-containing protein [Clostridium sp.]MCM1460315.1 DUF5057 domain-containing protein [Bacteroides sp.]